ncbi:hypothetical protein [Selenihalanaerobacter shriftii]|uniref:Uncharacterized protein n=1 Tax=Selenihalanaerobacter shriftii TaxID=142842 RepID=A0A1T4JME5_9FIRM|nr:hypothetical protein [Selenihalanaerobacter shriftii]SJZ31311.1 hypothetical protein SAMN02745118_00199 [Selenihalanaerobacter shriftii]
MNKHRKLYLTEATNLLQKIKESHVKNLDTTDCGLDNIVAGFYLLIGRMKKAE